MTFKEIPKNHLNIMSPDQISEIDQLLQKSKDDKVVRFCTGIIVERYNEVLLVRRVPHDYLGGYYELAGGGVDPGEDIVTGLIRECSEELGVGIKKIISILPGFDFISRNKDFVRQINFHCELESYNIKLNPDEHDHFIWVTKDNFESKNISKEMKDSLRIFFNLK